MASSARGRTVNTKNMGSSSPQVSAETQQLLKLMMEESKLTNFQRRQLNSRIKEGKSLPVSCNPSSSGQKSKKLPSKSPSPKKVLNGRSLNTCGKRPKEVIDILVEGNSSETYKPLPGKLITDKDKRKLQNQMAFGEDLPDISKNKVRTKVIEDDVSEIDEFDEVLQQIEDRQQFLKDMESLGEGKKYRPIIQTEISQKIRELELIDRQRTQQLEDFLENNIENSNDS